MNRCRLHACVFLILLAGFAGVCPAADATAPKAAEKTAIKAPATFDNLLTAYKLEVTAKAQYDAFAVKADAEGYKGVAALFRATAASQDILIQKRAGLIAKLGGNAPKVQPAIADVKSTQENLASAAAAAIGGKNPLYPGFAQQAEAEKNTPAVYAFKGAMAAEKEYIKCFQQALADLNNWKAEGKTFAVCEVCAFLVMGAPPATCPVCAAPREKFRIVK